MKDKESDRTGCSGILTTNQPYSMNKEQDKTKESTNLTNLQDLKRRLAIVEQQFSYEELETKKNIEILQNNIEFPRTTRPNTAP